MIRKNKTQSIDKFIEDALYSKNFGYYSKNNPFGKKGDFVTAPLISPLFSEMITIWVISFWIKIGKPKNFYLSSWVLGMVLFVRRSVEL